MMVYEEIVTENTGDLVLERVRYDVTVEGLMATCRLEQHYANPTEENLETVFTFPIAGDATLLEVAVRINGRTLKGLVKVRDEAQRDYEEAIDEGDRALLLEKNRDGHYTLSIANILPGDKVAVTLEYAQLLSWRQNRVRLAIPTTFTPKYGDPAALGLDDVTDPAFSFFAENRMHFAMRVKGVLAESRIEVPSHDVTVTYEGDETLVRLRSDAPMDKDLVVTFTTDAAKEARSFTLLGRDGQGYAAIASFFPAVTATKKREPKTVLFVVDCSGSMTGTSIQKARVALSKALGLLNEEDRFNILRFGSTFSPLFNEPVPADGTHLHLAKRMVRTMEADLGGTEMEKALEAAYAHLRGERNARHLFLVTDGAVYDRDGVVKRAEREGVRHYAVAVGFASDDVLLKGMADATGGAFVSVDPNEKMDHYILELFKKIDMPRTEEVSIQWPAEPTWQARPDVIFDGDTFYAYALFHEKPAGEAVLRYTLENGETHETRVAFGEAVDEETPSTVARLLAQRRVEELEHAKRSVRSWNWQEDSCEQEIVDLSVKYRLFSIHTSYILTDEIAEAEKPVGLPRTTRVTNMTPLKMSLCHEGASLCIPSPFDDLNSKQYDLHSMKRMIEEEEDLSLPPVWVLNLAPENIISPDPEDEPYEQLLWLLDWIDELQWWIDENGRLPQSIEDLEDADVWEYMKDWLDTTDVEASVKALLRIFVACGLVESDEVEKLLGCSDAR